MRHRIATFAILSFVASPFLLHHYAFSQWWNISRHYRVPVTVGANGYTRTDKPAEVSLNFTTLLGGAGTFNENSLRVVEVTSGGSLIDSNTVFQFDKDPSYNATTNALGAVVILLSGTTSSGASRYFHIYFDTGTGFTLPAFTNRVTITDNVFFQGQSSYQINNQLGTLWYHKVGGGFAGMRDLNNTEWIGFDPTPGSHGAGEYRGIPNMGQYGHPGYANGSSTIVSQGPIKVTIKTVTTDGTNARWIWDFYPAYQTMTLQQTGVNYWLLYEGIPNGTLDQVNGYWKNSGGGTGNLGTPFTGDLPNPEWTYFGQTSQSRFLYLVHHEDDALVDHYRPFFDVGSMTVFGFGRDASSVNHYLSQVPAHLTFGFGETESQSAQILDNSFRNLNITVGSVESSGFSVTGIQVAPGVTSAIISWNTNHPGTTSISYGLTASYGTTIFDTTKQSQHSVTLTGLSASTPYHFQIASTDTGGAVTTTLDQSFSTRAPFTGSTIQTDNFNSTPLNTSLWTFVNPVGDCSVNVNGTEASIVVPGGVSHDVWTGGNYSARLMQNCNNVDFGVEVKFNSPMSAQYQLQGILVQQDSANFIRFDFTSNGVNTRIFAASFITGNPTTRIDGSAGLTGISPLYLRVSRVGNTWSESYSFNDTTWTTAGSFTHALTVNSVGPFAGNAGPSPAFTSRIDFFKNLASVKVNVKAILEGAYDAIGDSMRTTNQTNLPLSQPYAGAPWNYTGLEVVASIPNDVVDWILIELRFAIDAASKVGTRAGFIKKDGTIVDLDGTSPLTFTGAPSGNYYIVVRHRNHLGIMSVTAATLSASSSLYDFSTSAGNAYGTLAEIQVGTGRYALYAGDVDASGTINSLDAVSVFDVLRQTGYNRNDINFSGIVSTADANIVFKNSTKATQVP